MKKKSILGLLIAASMFAGVLTGCGNDAAQVQGENNVETAQETDAATSSDHVFTVASSTDIGVSLNPHMYHSGAALYALNFVYEPLVMYSKGEIVPALADEWSVSEDGLTYTFHISEMLNSQMELYVMPTTL